MSQVDIKLCEDAMTKFMLEAGALALEKQDGIETMYKGGTDALTEADLAISKMAQKLPYLELDNVALVDEESIGDKTPVDIFGSSEYQWVVDPIDGTAGYAMGRFLWGIFIALYKNGQPLMAGMCMPAIGKLLLCTEGGAAHVNIATGESEPVTLKKHQMTSQIFVESDRFKGRDWDAESAVEGVWANSPESSAQGTYSVFSGQSAGMTYTKNHSFWDVAVAIALAKHTDFEMQSFTTGEVLEHVTAEHFQNNWKLKDNWLLSHPENYKAIKEAIF
jgi:fructose-1,6-bisphosphatase/inositol monophosphatase family enzyme